MYIVHSRSLFLLMLIIYLRVVLSFSRNTMLRDADHYKGKTTVYIIHSRSLCEHPSGTSRQGSLGEKHAITRLQGREDDLV